MNRVLALLVTIVISATNVFSQYNNIFIIDCSRSMICPDGNYKNEQPDIRWNPAKNTLKGWINEYEDNDGITILLFNDDVVSTIRGKKKDIDWNDVDKQLDKATYNHHGTTSICKAWSVAERYFDPSKRNYFYLITDGNCEHNNCPLASYIINFCAKIPKGHGYILEIGKSELPADVVEAVNSSPCLTLKPAGPLKHFGGFSDDEVYVTTSYMKSSGIDRSSPVYFSRKKQYPITASVNDSYFNVKVTNGCVNNGILTFDVGLKPGVDLNELKQTLNSDTYEIPVSLSSKEVDIDENKDITIVVTLKAVSELQLLNDVSQIELGKATYYNDFIIPRSNPDTLSYIIKPQFNNEALLNGSTATFEICGLPSPMRLLVNGEHTSDNKLTLSSNDSVLLQFVTDVPCEDFDIESSLRVCDSSNLDRLNGIENPRDFSINIGGEVYEKINPLKKTLIVLSVLLFIILLIWIGFNLIRPSMMGKLNIVDNNNETIKGLGDLAGFHKVILYSGVNKSKSGILDSLIFTKRKYVHIDGIPHAIKISGRSNKTLYIHPVNGLIINGSLLHGKLKLKAKTIFAISWSDNTFKIRIKYF